MDSSEAPCILERDPASVAWTRELVEEAIAAHGGPERLNLSGADLSGLDLSGMDLHGIVLSCLNRAGNDLICVDLRGARLGKVNLQGAQIRRVNLEDAVLGEANLQGANLRDANLQRAFLKAASLRRANLRYANLQKAILWNADLEGADLSFAELQEANLMNANLQRASFREATLEGALLLYAKLNDTVLSNVKQDGLRRVQLYGAELENTGLKKEQLEPGLGEELKGRYNEARIAYLSLKRNFEDLGDYESAAWAYIKERLMEKKCNAPWRARVYYGKEELGDKLDAKSNLPASDPRVWRFYLRHTVKWLSDWFVELICNYGEGPWRTVAAMGIVFALFTALYWITGAVKSVGQEPTDLTSAEALRNAIVFGLCKLTAMDPADLAPAHWWVDILTALEAMIGIGLTGLLGFVLGNRIRRA